MNIKNKIFIFIDDLYKLNARTNIFYGLSRNDDFPLGNYVVKYIIFHEKELNHYLNKFESSIYRQFFSHLKFESGFKLLGYSLGKNFAFFKSQTTLLMLCKLVC